MSNKRAELEAELALVDAEAAFVAAKDDYRAKPTAKTRAARDEARDALQALRADHRKDRVPGAHANGGDATVTPDTVAATTGVN